MDLTGYFPKHEIEVLRDTIVVDGREFAFHWCPRTAREIARRHKVPLHNTPQLALLMIVDFIERVFNIVRYLGR